LSTTGPLRRQGGNVAATSQGPAELVASTPTGSPSKSTVVPKIFVPLKRALQHAGGEGTGQGLHGEGGGAGRANLGNKGKKEAKHREGGLQRQDQEEDEEQGDEEDEVQRQHPSSDEGNVSGSASTRIFVHNKKHDQDTGVDGVDGGVASVDGTGASGAASPTGATEGGALAGSG
jgi:hypothetical protein